MALIWAANVKGLKPAAKIVLIQLADFHNKETGQCNPSAQRLADECEMGRATLFRHMTTLEECGFVTRHARGDGDGGRGVALQGKEGFANGDFDFLFTPRHDLIVATDHAECGDAGGFTVEGDLAGAVEQEALGDEVIVVIDEGLFDEGWGNPFDSNRLNARI